MNKKIKAKSKIRTKNKNESISLATRRFKSAPVYISVLILWGVYLSISLNSPNTSQNSLKLSDQTLVLLKMSVALPYLLTWLAAAYSIIKLKRYALAITPSKESGAFHKIAMGVGLLLGSLILSTYASSLRSFFVGYVDMRSVLTIITNYAYVFPYLAAFIYLLKGSLELARLNGVLKLSIINYLTYGIPLIMLAYIWLELIFTNQSRVTAGAGSPFASYYLKDSLLILTIVLPSLITWIIGILTVIHLRSYYQKVTGILYRRALVALVYGFIGVIFASIFFQALLSLGARRLLDLGLERLLGLIYIFLILQAIGFILITRGSKKLTQIEAV